VHRIASGLSDFCKSGGWLSPVPRSCRGTGIEVASVSFPSTTVPWCVCKENVNFRKRLNLGKTLGHFQLHTLLGDDGQELAEYAIMLAVVLVIVTGTVRLISANSGSIFSQVGSSIQ
jgi:Flp pilus assembly pilin Flp